MGQKLPVVGIEFVEQRLEQTRLILQDWIAFSQILLAYPSAGERQGELEMRFLEIKSRLARQISVHKARLAGECAFDSDAMNIIAGSPTLHQIYAQSEVAVKKLNGEWHRCYIGINEALGDLEELQRKVLAGNAVIFAGKLVKARRPIPRKQIAAALLIALVVFCGGASLYFMRHFLGFWAPAAGAGYEMEAGLSDEHQINVLLGRMKGAFDRRELDTVMAAFADDFRDVEGRDKTLLRALLQSYSTAFGLDQVELDIDRAKIEIEGDQATVSPVGLRTPEVALMLLVEGRKRDGRWLITYINGA